MGLGGATKGSGHGSDEESVCAVAWIEGEGERTRVDGDSDFVELGQTKSKVGAKLQAAGTEGDAKTATAHKGHRARPSIVIPTAARTARDDPTPRVRVTHDRRHIPPIDEAQVAARCEHGLVDAVDAGRQQYEHESTTPRPPSWPNTVDLQQPPSPIHAQGEAYSPMTRYILTASSLSNYTDIDTRQGQGQAWVLKPLDSNDTSRGSRRVKQQRHRDRNSDVEEDRHPFARGGVAHSPEKPKVDPGRSRIVVVAGEEAEAKEQQGQQKRRNGSGRTAIAIGPPLAPQADGGGQKDLIGGMRKMRIHNPDPDPVEGRAGDTRLAPKRQRELKFTTSRTPAQGSSRSYNRTQNRSHAGSELKRQVLGYGEVRIGAHAGGALTADALRAGEKVWDRDSHGRKAGQGHEVDGREARRPPKSGMDQTVCDSTLS